MTAAKYLVNAHFAHELSDLEGRRLWINTKNLSEVVDAAYLKHERPISKTGKPAAFVGSSESWMLSVPREGDTYIGFFIDDDGHWQIAYTFNTDDESLHDTVFDTSMNSYGTTFSVYFDLTTGERAPLLDMG